MNYSTDACVIHTEAMEEAHSQEVSVTQGNAERRGQRRNG
jgi:hypothetical protein